jgi:hypothetical protein
LLDRFSLERTTKIAVLIWTSLRGDAVACSQRFTLQH